MFGEALKDVYETLIQCEETDIAKKLEKFIADLIACTECRFLTIRSQDLTTSSLWAKCIFHSFSLSVAKCANFAIDIGLEIVILYERIYEIYGDIYAAKNCFDIDAYEMGKKKQCPYIIIH